MNDSAQSHRESIDAALAVMDAHIVALNARDNEAIARTLHFPHYRLSEGALKVWKTPDAYFDDFKKRSGTEWGYSAHEGIDVVRADDNKVHLDVCVARFRPDGSRLALFYSLWVIARIDGVWAAQLRSSFAQDSRLGENADSAT